MDKQAALHHFKEHHFTPLLDIQLDMLEAKFQRCQAQLIFDFKESFRDLCIHILSMQQQGQKDPIDWIYPLLVFAYSDAGANLPVYGRGLFC
ncbi:hypothetical protein [Paenibacillus polymyxa]|uniref:hypothetical protein n=1 Tax=Paenibacillus polymyxa TaxID=1406 RepID=UPI000AF468FC|nr:hypothetical protein [Paenibacillus polymyxa]